MGFDKAIVKAIAGVVYLHNCIYISLCQALR